MNITEIKRQIKTEMYLSLYYMYIINGTFIFNLFYLMAHWRIYLTFKDISVLHIHIGSNFLSKYDSQC